jgi:GDP-D-mannose dehydratase
MAVALYYRESKMFILRKLEFSKRLGHAKDYVEAMWRILQQDILKIM